MMDRRFEEAYTAGKGLFSELILPTISKVTTAIEDVEKDIQAYSNANDKVSNESKLDEDKLNQQISIKEAMKVTVAASISLTKQSIMNNPTETVLENLINDQNKFNTMSSELEEDIQELKDKLEKLQTFDSETSGLFTNSLNNLQIAMQSCIILNNTVVTSEGKYEVPDWVNFDNFLAIIQETGVTLTSEQIEKAFVKTGEKYAEKASRYIWSNRYNITLPNGETLGRVPGATATAIGSTDKVAKGLGKYFGQAVTEVGGTFIGVGIDMLQGDGAEEAWGKEITTGVATTAVVGLIEGGSTLLVSAGLMSNPIGIGIVGTIAIGVGIGYANDWLRENFEGVKDFEDKVGQAVVSGWNNFYSGVGDFIGGLFS